MTTYRLERQIFSRGYQSLFGTIMTPPTLGAVRLQKREYLTALTYNWTVYQILCSSVFCFVLFLLLARYVPNDRTTSHFGKFRTTIIISVTGHPIHFMFGSRVWFSRSADQMALLPVGPNPRSRLSAVLHNFEWPYL